MLSLILYEYDAVQDKSCQFGLNNRRGLVRRECAWWKSSPWLVCVIKDVEKYHLFAETCGNRQITCWQPNIIDCITFRCLTWYFYFILFVAYLVDGNILKNYNFTLCSLNVLHFHSLQLSIWGQVAFIWTV